MSSTILYKFRSGTNFESLPLPGTSARLIDIKRAIVKAKKLDRNTTTGSLDFDFAIQNANTNEDYTDDNMILPRGTRIIVRRVATERNMGLLHRMMAAGTGAPPAQHGGSSSSSAARSDFYTIRSHDRVDEDEFVDQDFVSAPQAAAAVVDENAELEALQAVLGSGGGGGGNTTTKASYVAGAGGPSANNRGGMPPHFAKPPPHHQQQQQQQQRGAPIRPNADPELRQQELPRKKTTTGIPRTFLSLSAPVQHTPAEGDNELSGDHQSGETTTGGLASKLNPNQHVFQDLLNRAGGQSIDAAGKRRDLDYALKLTATSIPDHLQCGICHSVVKNAMLVPWDPEGRPTCESCIRDSLALNGFKCPLTGTEGVSPDDLFPNVGLRKAADLFVKDVMEKMDQIEKQIEAEEAEEEKRNDSKDKEDSNIYEGDAGESGTLLARKAAKAGSGKKGHDDDLFGGGDDFGGDVFDVAGEDLDDEDENVTDEPIANVSEALKSGDKVDPSNNTKTETTDAAVSNANDQIEPSPSEKESEVNATEGTPGDANNEDSESSSEPTATHADSREQTEKNDSSQSPSNITSSSSNARRKEASERALKRPRGPPAGYMLGPAGAASAAASPKFPPPNSVPPPPPPRGPPMGRGPGMNEGRGPPGGTFPDYNFGGRGRGGGRFGGRDFGRGHPGNDWNRKRGIDQMNAAMNQGMMNQGGQGGWGGGQRDFNYRGNPHYQGPQGGLGYHDGRGRGGPPPQGRGGGRGGFRGRGGRGRF